MFDLLQRMNDVIDLAVLLCAARLDVGATRSVPVKATEGRLAPDDVGAGTFTLTNLGMFDVDVFHAILNPPQSAILATGRIAERVTALNGAICVRPSLFVTLSADHRVVDGVTGARFLQELKALLESLCEAHTP